MKKGSNSNREFDLVNGSSRLDLDYDRIKEFKNAAKDNQPANSKKEEETKE